MTHTIDKNTYTAVHYDRTNEGKPVETAPLGFLLHHGGGSIFSDTFILTGKDPKRIVGCNYYVTRAGIIYQLAPDTYRCWHAGAADHASKRWWGNNAAAYGILNGNRLIGVETEHNPTIHTDWPDPQMDALDWLFRSKIKQWAFPLHRLGAHKWYAPNRKDDPAHFSDEDLQAWLRTMYVPEPTTKGWTYEVAVPQGARIRQGPGTQFPTVTTLPEGYQFYVDTVVKGESVAGSDQWMHFAGPTRQIPNPLGFIFSGICERVQ